MDNNAIRRIAVILDRDIRELHRQLAEKKSMLEDLAGLCDHPNIQIYRGRKTGVCEFCLKAFPSTKEIDRSCDG